MGMLPLCRGTSPGHVLYRDFCTSFEGRQGSGAECAQIGKPPGLVQVGNLDGRNRAIVVAESLARVIVAIRIASVRWRSYLPPQHRN